MEYRLLHKDLSEKCEACFFCGRKLSSSKAYVLKHLKTGDTVLSGPECAKKNLAQGESLNNIPDLTKFTDVMLHREGDETDEVRSAGAREVHERKLAIEYLILRQAKLCQTLNCSYSTLKKYYDIYLDGELDDKAIEHINNIEKKSPFPLQLVTLQKCYNYLFWIDIAIAKIDEKDIVFLKNIRNYLIKHHCLSENQIAGLNKWFVKINGLPELK